MRRFTFYLVIALLTFAIGSFVAFEFSWKDKDESANVEKVGLLPTDFPPQVELVQSLTIQETEQFFPNILQENDDGKTPFCQDKTILPVWNLITKDKYFLKQSGGLFRNPNCSEMFEILNFDLNQDGTKEILLRGKSSDLCDAVGNCGFWIFAKKGKNYQKVLADSDYIDITEMGNQITQRKTNGYYDILLKGHLNAADTKHSTYQFNGQKYVENKCLVDYYIRNSNPNSRWKFISCREYEKQERY